MFPCKIADNRFVMMAIECGSDEDDEDGTLGRVKREVAILQTCSSHHLPRIGPIGLCTFERDGKVLILFSEEYIDGPTLEATLLDGYLPIDEVVNLALDITSAIDDLWKQHKIHRDIKPSNIIRRSADGTYVLLDPGIAFDQEDQSLTGDGIVPHTVGFLAPEQINSTRKREADQRADFFLLGIVLYIAITQRHPFVLKPNQSRNATVQNILVLTPPAPNVVRSDVPEVLSTVVMRLLEKKKHLRYRDCEQLRLALNAFREG